MKSRIYLLILLFLAPIANAQTTLTAKQIADQSFKVTKLAGSEGVSTMTIMDGKGNERVRKIAQVTKLYDNGDTEKRLVRFLAPAARLSGCLDAHSVVGR